MIPWATSRTKLIAAVQYAVAAEYPGLNVFFELENEASFFNPLPHVALMLSPIQPVGIDEVVALPAADPLPGGATDKGRGLVGQRQLTWSLKVEADTQQDGAGSAREILSLISTRLRRPDVLDKLRESTLAIATIGSTIDGSFNAEGVTVSFATCDVVLNGVMNDTAYTVPIIKTVRATDQITDPDTIFEVIRP